MIKACIFDLDGTLSDTVTSIAFSANSSLKKEGLMELPKDNFKYYAGNGAGELVRRYLKDTKREVKEGIVLNEGALVHEPDNENDFQYYFDSYMAEFSKYCMYEVKPYAGILELLNALKNRGIKLAVLSNKPDAQTKEVVADLFGNEFFDRVYGHRPSVERKPSPAGALQIAKELSVKPEECLYFGDTDTDMQTGKNAGMKTVGVLWGFRDKEELESNGADIIISSPEEIIDYI
ncbi:MAG: HAD family hydrolase [Eubacteriales bacterium]|nr:HAD family hydrolase [Eubacteriales bacterium]